MLIGGDDISNVCLHSRLFSFRADRLAEIWQLSRRGATRELKAEFKFQRRTCKLSFLFPPRRQSAPETLLAGYWIMSCCFKSCWKQCDDLVYLRASDFLLPWYCPHLPTPVITDRRQNLFSWMKSQSVGKIWHTVNQWKTLDSAFYDMCYLPQSKYGQTSMCNHLS